MDISLKAARVNAGLTQKQVAETLGITEPTVISWEKGKTVPDARMMQKLAELYHADIQHIIFI